MYTIAVSNVSIQVLQRHTWTTFIAVTQINLAEFKTLDMHGCKTSMKHSNCAHSHMHNNLHACAARLAASLDSLPDWQPDITKTIKWALKTEPSRMYHLYILLQRKEQVKDPRSVLAGA